MPVSVDITVKREAKQGTDKTCCSKQGTHPNSVYPGY